jgi:hypothetical protein
MGRYLDLIRDVERTRPSHSATCDQSDESGVSSLPSLMSQVGSLSHRGTEFPSGVDAGVSRQPPFAQPSPTACIERGFSSTKPILEIPAATKAFKATKPTTQSEAKTERTVVPALLFRLHRFRADDIPADAPDDTRELIDQACSNGTVLVPDGCELIVVERPKGAMSPEALAILRANAGPIIAALRCESHTRCARKTPGDGNDKWCKNDRG